MQQVSSQVFVGLVNFWSSVSPKRLRLDPASRGLHSLECTEATSYSFWTRRLKSDRAVIGKLISLRGVLVKIVAIAPKGFYGTDLPPGAPDLWMPLSYLLTPTTLAEIKSDVTLPLHVLGRRRAGITDQQVSSHLAALVGAQEKNRVKLAAKQATAFQTNIGGFRGTSTIGIILLGAVSIILLIGCVNLINLTLSRNEGRKREIAVHLSIGASRFRIVQQLCAEGLLLGIAGAIIGFGLSTLLCQGIQIGAFAALHRLSDEVAAGLQLDLTPDWTVFVFTLLISFVAAAVVGVWPAWSSTQTDLNSSLRREGLNRGQRHFLLTAQIAACFILLSAAGLLVRGAWQSRSARPGFEVDHLLVMTLDVNLLNGPEAECATTLKATLNQINSLPGVTSVALVDRSPFLGTGASVIENEHHKHLVCRFNRISAAYFKTLRMPLLSGHSFSQAEADRGKPEVVISEAAATALWPGQNPIGRIIHLPGAQSFGFRHSEFTVIGVTRVVRNTFLSKPDAFYLYFPKPISDEGGWVIARTEHSPEAALPFVREALMHASPALASHAYLVTLEKGPVQIQKLMTALPGMTSLALGLLALILAAIGVYGVVMYLVNQRVRSIGIHIALGAQRFDIIRLVVGEGLSCVVKGACIGLAGGQAVSALLATSMKAPDLPDLTYQAGAWNPLVFLCPLAALVIAVVAACLQSVLRATRIPAALVLRAD
jgi:predicted permease